MAGADTAFAAWADEGVATPGEPSGLTWGHDPMPAGCRLISRRFATYATRRVRASPPVTPTRRPERLSRDGRTLRLAARRLPHFETAGRRAAGVRPYRGTGSTATSAVGRQQDRWAGSVR